jgi:hypothetical protein
LARAAFYVEAPGGVATAWPVGPRTLATNAHVAINFANLKSGQTMIVRTPGKDGKVYQVVDYKIHPGYRAFGGFLAQEVVQRRVYNLSVDGYDVGLLTVKEDLPADSILELAPADELRALSSGTAVAMAGYPAEEVAGAPVRSYGAVPELHVGTVTSTSDFFFFPADFEKSQLVHHDLPETGGSSGSPIVGRSGRVVAVNSAANFHFYQPDKARQPVRIPTGVLINYGQRVDVLRSLMAGNAERELTEERSYWSQQLGKLRRGQDIIATLIAGLLRDSLKTEIEFTRVNEQTLTLSGPPVSSNGVVQRQKSQDVQVPTDSEYVISAYAHDGSPIELFVYAGNKPIAQDNADQKFVRVVSLKPSKDTTLTAWVISKVDRDVTCTLQVHKFRPKPAA